MRYSTRRPKHKAVDTAWIQSQCVIDESGCWIWQRAKTKDGYGKIGIAGKEHYTHRLVAEFTYGKSDQFVLHSCDNPACCNPLHLRYGDNKANMIDRRNRTGNPNVQVLGAEEAYRIKFLETGTQNEIAQKYNTTQSNVSAIRLGKSWRDLTISCFDIHTA